jgi:ferredoxin
MRVWIDQDGCTGAGLCVDHCPDLFVVLEDGIGYVHDHRAVIDRPGQRLVVPLRYEHAVIDAVERCPGECIYVEPDPEPSSPTTDDSDIVDADIV